MGLWSTASGSDNLCTTHTYKNPKPQIRRSLSQGSGLVITLSFEGRERVFVSKIRNHFDRGMCRGGGGTPLLTSGPEPRRIPMGKVDVDLITH